MSRSDRWIATDKLYNPRLNDGRTESWEATDALTMRFNPAFFSRGVHRLEGLLLFFLCLSLFLHPPVKAHHRERAFILRGGSPLSVFHILSPALKEAAEDNGMLTSKPARAASVFHVSIISHKSSRRRASEATVPSTLDTSWLTVTTVNRRVIRRETDIFTTTEEWYRILAG